MKNRVVGYAMALAVGFGTGSLMSNGVSANTAANGQISAKQGTDAAFRDGLFMGKHDADEGHLRHVSAGRWSTSSDRSQFRAGYDAGFTPAAVR